jgi:hypothetical protein
VEDSVTSHSPSAWRLALLVGLASLAVCSISVALDSASAAAAERDLGTPSVVELPALGAETTTASLADDAVAAVPSGLDADLAVLPEIPITRVEEAVTDLDNAVVAAAPDVVGPMVSDVTEQVVVVAVPLLDVPALPVPALPVPALPVPALPVPMLPAPVTSTASAPAAATQDMALKPAGTVLRDSEPSPAASATSLLPQSASIVPTDQPLRAPDGIPHDTAPPAGTPVQPRSSSGPSSTSYPTAAADVAGNHPAIASQRAILPISWAAVPHAAPSFDPGCTPD